MLDRRVSGDQAEQHPDPPGLCGIDHGDQVVIGSVSRCDPEVIGDVISGIDEGRGEAGLNQMVFTPCQSRWASTPGMSPMTSPVLSAKDCGWIC